MKVYLAAPLFSETERRFNLSLSDAIADSCTVYLPQRDGPLVSALVEVGMAHKEAGRMAYEQDFQALSWCDVLIAVLDGRALDEGVCIEMGFAKALGKRIIGLKTDVRCALPWGNNPLVDGCVDEWVHSEGELSTCIQRLSKDIV